MKIAVVTTTRAEYGILYPLIRKLDKDNDIDMQLLVTGTHLSEKHGNTWKEIEEDNIPIYERFPILTIGNTVVDISLIMANALRQFAGYFDREKPACVVILGDRTELLGICGAAINAGIPIVHLHGGELTEGAVDDRVRHAVTKLAYLHFPSTEVYKRRIIQMGELPDRVFNVGALGIENLRNIPLIDRNGICKDVGIPEKMGYAVVTFHPVTTEHGCEREQIENLIAAMENKGEYFYLITKANADAGGDVVNNMLEKYTNQSSHAKLVASLGRCRYLSAVKHADFVLGNSSSGIIEAPSLGTPTVNIGERQKGRLMADSVINCRPETKEIVNAIEQAACMEHVPSFIYGDGKTSDRIVKILKDIFSKKNVDLKKKFYDIEF